MSYARITVTGAVIVFSTLRGASAGRSRSLASFDRRKANRAGLEFALVGAHFNSSYRSRTVWSVTRLGCHLVYERASRKSESNTFSSTVVAACIECPSWLLFDAGTYGFGAGFLSASYG